MTDNFTVDNDKLVELARTLVKDYVVLCIDQTVNSKPQFTDFSRSWVKTIAVSDNQKLSIRSIAKFFIDRDLEEVIIRGRLP